jgi:hypothetical protein
MRVPESAECPALADGAVAQQHSAQLARIAEVQRFCPIFREFQDDLVGAEGLGGVRRRVFGCWCRRTELKESQKRQEGAAYQNGGLRSDCRCWGESFHALHLNPLD